MILERQIKRSRVKRTGRSWNLLPHKGRWLLHSIRGWLLLGALAGLAACGGGTGGSTSSAATGTGGTGVGWTVQVKVFKSTLSLSAADSTSVVVNVRDAAGGYAPKGTRVCLSTTHGLIWVDELGKDSPVISGCITTSNDIGQVMGTYVPLKVGIDQVQASSQGGFGSTAIQVID